MLFKNNSNLVFTLGLLASAIFWCIDALIDVLIFGDEDDSILESLFFPETFELYMRCIVLGLFLFVSLITRTLLRKQESISRELEKHKHNLENLVEIRTEQLEKLATIDDLTQIYNRRKFFELAHYEIDRNARHQHPLSIIMIDIDHFKKINDIHGHQVGDKTLQIFSQIISSIVRTTDIFGRIGGEEFAIVLPETTKQAAKEFAERIRVCAENENFPVIKHLTVSIGVTPLYPDDSYSSIFNRADNALYAAKDSGRNCVITA